MGACRRWRKLAGPVAATAALLGAMAVPALGAGAGAAGASGSQNVGVKATTVPLLDIGTVTLAAIAKAERTSGGATSAATGTAGTGGTSGTGTAGGTGGAAPASARVRLAPFGRPGYAHSVSGRTRRAAAATAGAAPRAGATRAASTAGRKGAPAGPRTTPRSGLVGFTGISGPAQAPINGFGDLEPPDQGSCAGPAATGKTLVIETINTAFAAWTQTGRQVYPDTANYRLFDQSPGAFLSDPRCYYDASTGRWFFTDFSVGSATGATPSTQFVAVSETADPLGAYAVFGMTTTDLANGGGGCPCFGDYDMIGADANGFYISTNEFDITGPHFNGAVVYALSKAGLESAADGGALPSVARYAVTRDAFSAGRNTGPYHLAPSLTPPGGSYAPGTEYFVESNSSTADTSGTSTLLVYALTGTQVLAQGGIPSLAETPVATEHYAFPPGALQKAGPLVPFTQFGTGFTTCNSCDNATGMPELQADFDAVQEVTYTDGMLIGELDTALPSGRDGVDWFTIDAATSPSGSIAARLAHQGYIQSTQSLLYPDVVVNASGTGYVDFAVSGPTTYPSAGYVAFHATTGPSGSIGIAANGAAPEDGFTCGTSFTVGCRWGDYSGGAVWGGRVYLMTEYVPPTARDTLTNWGTFVWSLPTA